MDIDKLGAVEAVLTIAFEEAAIIFVAVDFEPFDRQATDRQAFHGEVEGASCHIVGLEVQPVDTARVRNKSSSVLSEGVEIEDTRFEGETSQAVMRVVTETEVS